MRLLQRTIASAEPSEALDMSTKKSLPGDTVPVVCVDFYYDEFYRNVDVALLDDVDGALAVAAAPYEAVTLLAYIDEEIGREQA